MKERQQLDSKDIAVLEILDDPVFFGEFIRDTTEIMDDDDKGWKFDGYQKNLLLDKSPFMSACTGRSTGKTTILETKVIHTVISNKYRKASANEVLLVVQNKAQLDPIFLRLTQLLRRHPFLRFFIDRTSINFSQHEIKLLNGALIRCRIVGSTADSNIIGLHVPCIFVDEGQVFSYVAWKSLQQVLTSWDDGYQLWVSGVPNGLREKNVLYECDQQDNRYSRHNISRLSNSRYTTDQHERDLKQYGGKEGDDYVHLVLGQHGSPAFSVFDRKLMRVGNYPVAISLINNQTLDQAEGKFNEILNTPDAPIKYDLIALAGDIGFSNDPTMLTILYSLSGTWREHSRFELRRIKYPTQAKIIDWLDSIYGFNMITLDAGSSGLALGHILQETEDYKSKNYIKRLTMVDFQGSVITGYDEEGKETKERVRKFTINLLQKWCQNDQIIEFSLQDDDVISELERVGFTRDMLGQPKYFVYSPNGGQKGDDHILASILTWVYGSYYNYYLPSPPSAKTGKYSDLAKGGWNVVRIK
jgi:hypothetical protein